ncbi:S1 family peptidase [Methanimicrococcus sp. OttesenSCG-928-J09]|nr:S1 family peptidase [Methanimicrococcus sp. OttesenSCG-928-J09]
MVCFVSLVVLLFGFMTPAAAINDLRYSSYHNMTAEEIQRIVDETTGTEIDRFDGMKIYNPDVIEVFGIIPEKAKGVEAYEYWLQMGNISRALANDEIMQQYHYENGGPVIGQGTQCICYTSIMILSERADEITMEDMLIIKSRVDMYAAKEGLEDPPLAFFRGEMIDSYLTEEQILYLWESGYEGLRVYDGIENLTRLRDERNAAMTNTQSAGNIGFEDYGNQALSTETTFIDRLLSVFKGSSNDYVELSRTNTNYSNLSSEKVRPLVGGLMVATSTSGGTIGYAAKDASNPDLRGIVTVAHVFHFENATSYQPRQGYGDSNSIGTFSKMNKQSDSVFIPMESSNVRAAIYTGAGDDQLLDVIGYEGAVSSGMPMSKSGAVSGNTGGNYYGVRYNQTFTVKNGTINYTVSHVGVIQESSEESVSVPGDSGGPVYVKTKAMVNGTEQEVAVLLGILEGGDGKGTVYYVPCTEIKDRLGVVPLTINDR